MNLNKSSRAGRLLATAAFCALALAGGQRASATAAPGARIPGVALDVGKLSSEQLFFDAGWEASDNDLWAIRNHIAQHDAMSPAGLAARAWLADTGGQSDEALDLYRQCLKDERVAAYCGYRLLRSGLRDKVAAADFARISALADRQAFGALRDPADLLNNIFFYRVDVLKDEPGAFKQLAKWEKDAPKRASAYLLIRGESDYNKTDYAGALDKYLKAAKANPGSVDPSFRLVDLIIDHFDVLSSQENAQILSDAPYLKGDKAVVALALCLKYVTSPQAQPKAASELLIHTADRLRKELKVTGVAYPFDLPPELASKLIHGDAIPVVNLYGLANQLHPSGEAVAGMVAAKEQMVASSYQPDVDDGFDQSPGSGVDHFTIALLSRANEELPDNPTILDVLGERLSRYDRAQADALFKQALQLPMPASLRKKVVDDYATYVYERWNDYAPAAALYRQNMEVDRRAMLGDLFWDREYAGDFEGASRALDELYAYDKARPGGVNEPWFERQRHLLGRWTQDASHTGPQPLNNVQSALPLKPILSTDDSIAVTPDDRFAAIGIQPVQLVDLKTGGRVREFGRGGPYRAFSPDGRYLAVESNFTEGDSSDTNQMLVYEVATGRTVVNLVRPDKVNALAWDPKGGRIAFVTDNTVNVYDMARHSLASRPLPSYANGWKLAWAPKTNQLAVGLLWGNGIQIFDPDTLKLTRVLQGPRFTHALSVTGDGRYLVAVDNDDHVFTWDAQNLDAPLRVGRAGIVGAMASRPGKSQVLISDIFDAADPVFGVFDATTGELAAQASSDKFGHAQFAHDGALLFRAQGADVEVRDASTLKVVRTLPLGAAKLEKVAYDGPAERLLVGDSDGLTVWNLAGRTRLKVLPGLHLVDDSHIGEGKVLVRRGPADTGREYLWLDTRALGLRPIVTASEDFKVTASAVRGDVLVLAGIDPIQMKRARINDDVFLVSFADLREDPNATASVASGWVETYDLRTGRKLAVRQGLVVPTAYGTFDFITDPKIETVDVSDDGANVAFTTSWVNGRLTGRTFGDTVRVVRLSDGAQLKKLTFDGPVHSAKFAAGGRIQAVLNFTQVTREIATDTFVSADDRYGNERHVIELPKSGGSVVYQYDQLARIDAGGRRIERWYEDNLDFVAADDARGRLITVTRQGTVAVLDLNALNPAAPAPR
jgi:WD40 repeat protein